MIEKVLVVEDEPVVGKSIRLACEQAGYTVRVVPTARAALDGIRDWQPDVVLLDLLLPDGSGLHLCRRLREQQNPIPIIMVTALADEVDRIVGLEMGADDYVTKPFSTRELVARIRAVLRRTAPIAADREEIRLGELVIRPWAREVLLHGQIVHLTSTEYGLLALLASSLGTVFEREQIIQRIWGYEYEGAGRLLDVHMSRLRDKIEDDPSRPRHLLTVRGVGYRLVPHD